MAFIAERRRLQQGPASRPGLRFHHREHTSQIDIEILHKGHRLTVPLKQDVSEQDQSVFGQVWAYRSGALHASTVDDQRKSIARAPHFREHAVLAHLVSGERATVSGKPICGPPLERFQLRHNPWRWKYCDGSNHFAVYGLDMQESCAACQSVPTNGASQSSVNHPVILHGRVSNSGADRG